MASPDNSPPGPQGSSRATGGFMCGCAHGIALNIDRSIPRFIGAEAGLAAQDAAEQRAYAATINNNNPSTPAAPMEIDRAPLKLVVLDGLVGGPQHCAFDDCTAELHNSCGGVFCIEHLLAYGSKFHVQGCLEVKIASTQACQAHQGQWKTHLKKHNCHTYAGAKRMLKRPGETLAWQTQPNVNTQPHDAPAPEGERRKNYFTAPRFYCVETLCAPCGVVIAWTKFDKAESPTNILNWLETVYPTPESRPDYICIDKACQVFHTSIRNGSWSRIWKETTRFIVDSYHYINH